MTETLTSPASARPESEAPFAPESRVGDGRYRIVRFIAAGAMGEVYEAEDLVVRERVAIKVLRAHLATSAAALERLRREIATARKVTHANVVRIHDLGQHAGRVFLTMELLDGETLAARIARGAIADAELGAIARQLVAGLGALHAAGIVHRDFKSANVVLAGERVVITDFGLARAAHVETDTITSEGTLLGTPGYMAPEQVEGREATAASDIYALGIVLYELVTGTRPFQGDTPIATATARLTRDPVPPAQLVRAIDPGLDRAILRCLARDPAARFAHVEDVLAPARARRRWPIAVAAVAVAVVVGAIMWPSGESATDDPQERIVAHLRRHEATKARALLEPLVARDPEDPWLHYQLADALRQLGEGHPAAKHTQLAFDKRTVLDQPARLRIEVDKAFTDHQFERAVEITDRLIASGQATVDDWLGRAWLLEETGRTAEAHATLALLRANGYDDPRIDFQDSNLWIQRDLARARELAARALDAASRHGASVIEAEALNVMAAADAVLGNLPLAEAEAEQSHDRYASEGHHHGAANIANTLTMIRFVRGRYVDAIRAARSAIEQAPTRAIEYEGNLAIALALTGQLDEASAWVDKITGSAEPFTEGFPRALIAERRGDLPGARGALDRWRPTIADGDHFKLTFFHWTSGQVHSRTGDLAAARRDFEAAIIHADTAAMLALASQSRTALAGVALAEGKPQEAIALARRAIDELTRYGSVASLGFAYATLAEAQRATGDTAGARDTLARAADACRDIQDPVERDALRHAGCDRCPAR